MTLAPERIHNVTHLEQQASLSEKVVEHDQHDTYVHLKFTEISHPVLAEAARRVHAEGYSSMDFVKPEAITEEGCLPSDMDKARGPLVDYYLAMNPKDDLKMPYDLQKDRATMRKYNLSTGGTYKDLPAYKMCGGSLSEMGLTLLDNIRQQDIRLKEISALARTRVASPLAVHEIFRHAIHEALGKDEVWFFSIVSTTYDSLVKNFGEPNFVVIGEDTPIDDHRVNPGIALKPTVLYPDTFIDSLLTSYQYAETPQDKHRFLRSFIYFTEGLDPSLMSESVRNARNEILGPSRDTPNNVVAKYVIGPTEDPNLGASTANRLDSMLADYKRNAEEWEPPREFDLSISADRVELEKRYDLGEVSVVRDAVVDIANDLFELSHPDKKNNAGLRAEFVDNITSQGSTYGRWFLFSSGQLVRYPTEVDLITLRTSRNRDLITAEEQVQLYDSRLAVFGLSVGSSIVRTLVTSGIGNTYILGDPDKISPSNLNRLHGGFESVGQSKVDHIAIQISSLDPYIRQEHFREGFDPDDTKRLAALRPDIIFDEVDDMRAKVALRLFAKRHGIPLVMVSDVGDRTIVDVERHDLGNVKLFGGRLGKKIIDKILMGTATEQDIKTSMRKIMKLRNVTDRMVRSVAKIGKSIPGMPQLGSTATEGGAVAAVTAREILLGRKMQTGRYIVPVDKILSLDSSISGRVKISSVVELLRTNSNK